MPVEYYLCSGGDPFLGANPFNCPPPILLILAVVLVYGPTVVLGILVVWEKVKDQRSIHSQQRKGRLVTNIGPCLFKISYGIFVIASMHLYQRLDPVSLTNTPSFLIVLLHHFFGIPTLLVVLVGLRLWSDQELKQHLKRHITSVWPQQVLTMVDMLEKLYIIISAF